MLSFKNMHLVVFLMIINKRRILSDVLSVKLLRKEMISNDSKEMTRKYSARKNKTRNASNCFLEEILSTKIKPVILINSFYFLFIFVTTIPKGPDRRWGPTAVSVKV
jgi:hypothetical protein